MDSDQRPGPRARRPARRPVAEAAGVEPPRNAREIRRRLASWWWPATQMAVAAAMAWLLSQVLLDSTAGYAPITAIVAMGLGRERRLWRSVVMAAGLLLGTAVAEFASLAFGIGWWQVAVILGASALAAGLLFDKDLAVTYATINAVVLHSTPGTQGWVPTRLLDGLLGVLAALLVTFGVAPSRPRRELADRLRAVTGRAVDGLELAARALRRDGAEAASDEVRNAATRIDHELSRVSGTVEHVLDLARWAPIRRRNLHDVEDLVESTSALTGALTTASTIVRLTHRALADNAVVGEELLGGLDHAATTIRTLVDDIIAGREPDLAVADDCRNAIEALLSEPADRAVVIAIQEEVRGLLDDLVEIAGALTGDRSAGFSDRVSTAEATADGIRFGSAAHSS